MKRLVFCGFVMLFLAACQSTFSADVTRFSAVPPIPPGKSFVVATDAGQQGDLEFSHYAGFAGAGLQAQGFKVAPTMADADIVALIHYGNVGSHTEVRSEPGPYWMGPRHRGWYGPYYPGPDIQSNTYYSQFVELSLLDGAAWRRNERQVLFQGRAYADSDVRDLNVAAPYLIRAILKDFPGVNGQTVRVSLPLDPAS